MCATVTEACDGDLADAMIGVDYFNNLSRIDAKGTVVCSALPLAKGINIADMRAVSATPSAAPRMVVSPQLISRATGQPVIGAQVALRKADGSFDGAVGIAWMCTGSTICCAAIPCRRARWWRCSTATA